ncbi:Patatin-like phospholipase domain-containing protein SPAC1786.01c [Taphrina deformans PYCC 5710]|uniref:Patatin-like phospholipase domain-containing protein SPAC1786.01c n=1 Tax=Taphrina deformans (strain PYCC 5710 / ATCC 11124 / CBS 356.35 / IMI 108563 / JCM 9778 / NBRC 8474) TaxID=1097556 RepID=R4X6F6_TAPDE|nr:Patatin-like phospholipase domain-containing protein SPAC1786.01c [Taphrina deformans PYCC 5710]|eukprot:CCG80650.1 Patatin-like phospholipase domain-containing protein SPAC1786.01c [Taphrina deformans PYCC 5710]
MDVVSNGHDTAPKLDDDSQGEEEIRAFAQAMEAEHNDEPVEFIKALNDWRPIHEHKKKRKRKRRPGHDEHGNSFLYSIFRWPLLATIFAWIVLLGAIYFVLRIYVAMYEHFVLWTGEQGRLRKRLRDVKSYAEFKEAAAALDTYQGHDEWKTEPEFDYYDFKTVRRVARRLKEAREKHNLKEIRHILETCIKSNFGGIESPRLYSMTYYGTKSLLDVYLEEVQQCLKLLIHTKTIPQNEKTLLVKSLSRNYGRTALCLSGGATFAYYHFGVVKALLDASLLPNVITGTSGGGIVASLCCTYTDKELKDILVPELADKITACHEDMITTLKRWYKTGAQFDAVDWARRSKFFTRGSTTFKEAYEKTGRILSISVIPSDVHSPSKLINYLTAPDTVIWSALLASAAVPGILKPVPLMQKDQNGKLSPYNFGNKWKDGSLRSDVPIFALNLYFNVTYTIVSQTNPHVKLWFFSPRGSVGRPTAHRRGQGWRGGFLSSALEQFLKHDLLKWLRVLRDLEILPRPAGQDWSSLFLQKFEGTITIWPKTRFIDFPRILSDPTVEIMDHMLMQGARATYPRLLFIENRLRIERLLEEGRAMSRKDVRQAQTGSGTVMSDSEAAVSKINRVETKRARVERTSSRLGVHTDGQTTSDSEEVLES